MTQRWRQELMAGVTQEQRGREQQGQPAEPTQPTPGMLSLANELAGSKFSTVSSGARRLYASDRILHHIGPELARERARADAAEAERDDQRFQYAGGRIRREAIECRNAEIAELRQQLAASQAEAEALRVKLDECRALLAWLVRAGSRMTEDGEAAWKKSIDWLVANPAGSLAKK